MTKKKPPEQSEVEQLAALIVEAARRLETLKVDESEILAKIREKEKSVESVKASIPAPPTIDGDRNALVVSVAMGRVPASTIDEFDRNSEVARIEYKQSVRPLEKEIALLEEQVEALRGESSALGKKIGESNAEHRTLCQRYLLALAEESGVKYLAAIHEAVKHQALIVEYASLHKRVGGENLIGEGYADFFATSLGLDSTRNQLPALDPVAWTARLDLAETEILASLEQSGIRLPLPATPPPPRKVRAPGIGEGMPVDIVREHENRATHFKDGAPRPFEAISDFDPFTGE